VGVEIERKFLVRRDWWHPAGAGERMRQGYLSTNVNSTVRVRLITVGDARQAKLTIKGPIVGLSRLEFEYDIPADDADVLLERLAGAVIDKTRYRERHGAHVWEIDVFHGANEGLLVAEVELASEGEEPIRPPWLGEEVTEDRRYANSALARCPYRDWDNTGAP
jgi:adenylate cyclase